MWPDSQETQELLHRAGGGEPAAVNQLLDRHRDSLRRMVQARMDRALARRVDVSDVVQEALIEASQRLGEYVRDPKMPFHLWLRHIARDQLIDTHRRHRVAQRRSLDREQSLVASDLSAESAVDLAQQLADGELTPAAATLQREFQQRFLEALEQLEDEDREVIVMRHLEQLSNSQVAELLGVTQPAAGMRHLRALRRLKEIMGHE